MGVSEDPKPVTRLGVLGGTFDPIHAGHLEAASGACRAFELDLVVFVPTGHPWQKADFSPPEDRWMMTLIGTRGDPRFAASRIEIDRRGLTYTADTVEELRGFYGPEVEIFFIAGADAVLNLGTWRGIERLARLACVVAVTRPGFDLKDLTPAPDWPEVRILEIPEVNMSSSELRARVRTGLPIDDFVPPDVVAYIRRRGLYTAAEEVAGA
jgi:nicotinate-nucleotide adenylyltransferase